MAYTAEQQRELLLRMANAAAAKGVPAERIDAKLKEFNTRIESGEDIFSGVLDRARELTQTKRNFNKATPSWAPSVGMEADNLRMSPNKMYAGGYNPDQEAAANLSADKAVQEQANPGGFLGFANSAINAGSSAARTLLAAGQTLSELQNPATMLSRDATFKTIEDLQKGEETRGSSGPGSVAGSFVGGIGTLGLGAIASGQDVIRKGGTLNEALAATAIDAAQVEAGLAAGKLLPNAGVASRMAAQGAAGGVSGIGARALKNQIVPESMKQDVFDPAALAFDIGGGAIGGIVPDGAAKTRTGDPAIDAGIAATEQLMRRRSEKVDVDVNKPFTKDFTVPKVDFSTTPKETVDASPLQAEVQKRADIEDAYKQLQQERLATVDKAYAQRDVFDRAQSQELPGIDPVIDPTRSSADQTVPRGTNLSMDQLSILRDQLKQQNKVPEPAPAVPEGFSTSFASDPRNAAPASRVGGINAPEVQGVGETVVRDPRLEQVQSDLNFTSKKASDQKVFGKPSWEWDPKSSEVTVRESRLPTKAKVATSSDLAAKLAQLEQEPLFNRYRYAPTEENATPRDFEELSRSNYAASPQQRASLKGVADKVREAGNAYNVADMIISTVKRNPERATTSELFQRFKDNPITADLMKKLKVSVINPEDLASSKSSVIQLLGPSKDDKSISWGVYHPSTGVAVLGEGFNKAHTGDHGLNPTTLAHEIVHGLTTEVVNAVEKGKISDPKVRAAIDEVGAWREVFGTEVSRLAKGDKLMNDLMQYGQTNVHEFMAVAASDPRVQTVMKNIKVGDVTMWQKFVGSVRKILGLRPKDEVMLDRVLSLTEQIAKFDVNAKSKDLMQVPGLETVPQRSTQKIEQAGLGSRVSGALRTALVGDGTFPLIRQAKEIASGEKAVGVETATTMGNLYNKETKKFTPEQIATLDKDMDIAIKNSSKPEGKEALARVEQQSKPIAGMIREFAKGRRARGVQYIKNLLENPNVLDSDKGLAYKILNNLDSYLVRAYSQNEFKNYGADKLGLAKSAQKKLSAGKVPFEREQKALDQTNALKAYLKKKYFPDNLDKLNSAQLEDLYKFYTAKEVSDVSPLSDFGDDNPKSLRKEFMRGEISKSLGKVGDLDEAIDQLVDIVAGVNKTAPAARYFKNLREGSDVKSTLDDVPESIRKFWGEAEKPIARMMMTVRNQAAINSQMNALASLHKDGMGTLFKEGPGHEGYTAKIEGEKMGPLQGLHVKPEVKAALESFVQTGDFLNSWKSVFMGDPTGRGALAKLGAESASKIKLLTSARKSASVLGNPLGASIRNLVGSGLQLVANGNVNPKAILQGAGDMAGLINLAGRTEINPQTAKLLKYKLAEASNLEDTYSPSAKRILQKLVDTDGFKTPDTAMQKINEAIKEAGYKGQTAFKVGRELYGAMDLWSKLANFRAEESFWTKYNEKYGGIDDVTKFAADRTNNTNITPGRASPVAKVSDYAGASTFLPYTTEVVRTLSNNLAYGFKDAMDGVQLKRPELIAHGIKRLLGTVSATTAGTSLLAGVVTGGANALGLTAEKMGDDTETKKYLSSGDFSAGSAPISFKDSEGKEYILDAGMLNPYDPAARPINLLIKAAGESDPTKQEKLLKEAYAASSSLLHQNSAWASIGKAIGGKTPSMAKSNEKFYQDSLETLVNDVGMSKEAADRSLNLGSIVAPKGAMELYKSMGENTDPGIKALMGTGVGVNRLDVAKDIANYVGPGFTQDLAEAKKGYTDLLKVDFDVNPKRVEAKFAEAIKDLAEPYNKLQLAVNAAKEQGKSEREILESLKLGRVTNKAVASLMRGQSPTIGLLISDLRQDIKDDLMRDKSGKAAERARRNMSILRDLIIKYKDTTAQEIVDGE